MAGEVVVVTASDLHDALSGDPAAAGRLREVLANPFGPADSLAIAHGTIRDAYIAAGFTREEAYGVVMAYVSAGIASGMVAGGGA